MQDRTKLSALIAYANDHKSSDKLRRFSAQANAEECDLLTANGGLRQECIDVLDCLKNIARNNGDIDAGMDLCAAILNKPQERAINDLYNQIMGNKH